MPHLWSKVYSIPISLLLNLSVLDLGENEIWTFHEKAVSQVNLVRHLNLQDNQIYDVSNFAFEKETWFYIRQNKFSDLYANFIFLLISKQLRICCLMLSVCIICTFLSHILNCMNFLRYISIENHKVLASIVNSQRSNSSYILQRKF